MIGLNYCELNGKMKNNKLILTFFIFIFSVYGIFAGSRQKNINKKEIKMEEKIVTTKTDTATFGEGCFWCTEAIFERLKGVISVTSGYAGGTVPNPSYEQVCTGRTGYAEVSQIIYDPEIISYDELLKVFFKTHDPTSLNRQGADVGTQYRSVIFYNNEEQKKKAEYYKDSY